MTDSRTIVIIDNLVVVVMGTIKTMKEMNYSNVTATIIYFVTL